MRKSFIGGNWKCNGTRQSVSNLVNILNENISFNNLDVVCAPTNLHLDYVYNNLNPCYELAIQNIWKNPTNGAFTGEITPDIASDFGIKWVIIGHSERRHTVAKETNKLLFDKVINSLNSGLKVIYCVGETLEERNTNRTFTVINNQLINLLNNLNNIQWRNVVIAYEPVWAIGTGVNATPEQANEVHSYIRSLLYQNKDIVRIIYGGSVKPINAKKLIEQNDIDGFLVGGCSLKKDFLDIINIVGNN
jgi:triosephosphate isomerase